MSRDGSHTRNVRAEIAGEPSAGEARDYSLTDVSDDDRGAGPAPKQAPRIQATGVTASGGAEIDRAAGQ